MPLWISVQAPLMYAILGYTKEQRTERIEARIKPSLYKKVERAMKVRNYRSRSAYFKDALIFFFAGASRLIRGRTPQDAGGKNLIYMSTQYGHLHPSGS